MNKLGVAAQAVRCIKNWPTYFVERVDSALGDGFNLIRGESVEYNLRNGLRYRIRPHTYDQAIIGEVWLHRQYTPPGFEIGPRDVVVDVGAHIGIFSLFASMLAKDGTVLALEPIAENFALLKENVALNGAENVIAINKGASDREEERVIYFSSESTAGHSFRSKENRTEERKVQTISLAALMKEHGVEQIDFMKMDCEGAEYEIMYGTAVETLRRLDKICIECHPIDEERNISKMAEHLQNAGFQVDAHPDTGYLYARRSART